MLVIGYDKATCPEPRMSSKISENTVNGYTRRIEGRDIRTQPDITTRISLDVGYGSVINEKGKFLPFLDLYYG